MMQRLTDKRTAEALRKNCEGLMKVGIQPDRMYLEYIKLAEYEEAVRKGASSAGEKVRTIMNDISKLMQIQSNLIDNMLGITEYIKNEAKEQGYFCFTIAEASDTLLKLATVFEKAQPKYITLEGKQNG